MRELDQKLPNHHRCRPSPAHLDAHEVAYVLDRDDRDVRELLRGVPHVKRSYFKISATWYHWDDVTAVSEPVISFEKLLVERHREPRSLSLAEVAALGIDPSKLPITRGADGSGWIKEEDIERARYRLDNPDAMTQQEAEAVFGMDIWNLPPASAAGEKWLQRSELQRLFDAGEIDRQITIQQVAVLVGQSVPSVYRLAKEGKIPCFKDGSRLRFRENEVKKILKTRETRVRF